MYKSEKLERSSVEIENRELFWKSEDGEIELNRLK